MSEKKIAKIAKLASNPFAQPDVRMREMQRLLADGSEAAVAGLLKRFAANADGHIADEDEKKWLVDVLTERGAAVLKPLQGYIREEKQLTYALQAYSNIAGAKAAVEFCLDALDGYGPDNYRAADAKLQLVWQLGEHLDDARVIPGLAPYLDDHSDDVRWAVMDLLEKAYEQNLVDSDTLPDIAQVFARLVTDDNIGPRIQRRAAEMASSRELQLPESTAELTPMLEEDFFLDKKKFIRRRAKIS